MPYIENLNKAAEKVSCEAYLDELSWKLLLKVTYKKHF